MGKDGVEEVDPQKDVEATKSGSWFWAKVRWFSVFVLGISILVALLQSQKVPESVVKVIQEDETLSGMIDRIKKDDNVRAAFDQFEDLYQQYNDKSSVDEDGLRPGERIARNRTAYTPVAMFPGITSSMLELWKMKECASGRFREKIWGSVECAKFAVQDTACWLEHLGLDEKTWEDPEGIRVRVVEGMNSMDYLMPGYFVWGKIFENLGDVGYDPRQMKVFPYDWRLCPQHVEERDGLMSRMQVEIELLVRSNGGRRVALMGHSMGNQMVFYFINWVADKNGPEWLTKHVDSWLNIAGPLLGVPKSVSTAMSGEGRDTVDFGRIGAQFTRGKFHTDLVKFFRSVGSLPWMLPRGSKKMWTIEAGDGISFPKDELERIAELFDSDLVPNTEAMSATRQKLEHLASKNYTQIESAELLRELEPEYMELVEKYYDLGSDLSDNQSDPRSWTNVLAKALPFTDSSTKIYCMYGYSPEVLTEYGYRYDVNKAYPDNLERIPMMLDRTSKIKEENVTNSIYFRPAGDGTVPLMSLAYPCLNTWAGKTKHNPAGVDVTVREYKHDPIRDIQEALKSGFMQFQRGGPGASTHIELLGNRHFLADMLNLITIAKDGSPSESLPERILSPIREMMTEAEAQE